MSTEVTQDRRSRRRLGILAGVAGGLLLLGGTTYALWTDSALQAGGTISNGNLDVEPLGTTTYWDTSADRSDTTAAATPVTKVKAHAITNIGTYQIVPGDTLEANYGFVVALSGDNMVASVNLALGGTGASAATGVTFTAQTWFDNGGTWTAVGSPVAVVPGGTPVAIALGNFQAANQPAGALDGALPVITVATTPGALTPNVTVVVTAKFDAATTGRVSALSQSVLGDATVSVVQTRTPGVGNFVAP